MKKNNTFLISYFLFFILHSLCIAQQNTLPALRFETSKGKETATYDETINFYEALDRQSDQIQLLTYGNTDSGKPLHLAVFSADKDFNIRSLKNKNKTIFFIINAIHPGESDGVDACMLFLRELTTNKILQENAKNTVLCIIPAYNIDGMLVRGAYSRANQNGPLAYGFRGNGRNLDLNRDFIKCDSENAKTFVDIFQAWQPDVFLDNHVSNGADYQYTMTYISTHPSLYSSGLGEYAKKVFCPKLEEKMAKSKCEMSPYVDLYGKTPENGIVQFMESPRYSNGYAALFHTLGILTETHMLKPYASRVQATVVFMKNMLILLATEGDNLRAIRKKSQENAQKQTEFVLDWVLDTTKHEKLVFKGYNAEFSPSKVTKNTRLSYNQKKPYTKEIPYYTYFSPKNIIKKPKSYIIPYAYRNIALMLTKNGVLVQQLTDMARYKGSFYYIDNFKTRTNAYESHYLHYDTQTRLVSEQNYQAQKGDFLVSADQPNIRFIVETLEPSAPDSYFNWNFFDGILQQKEGFSDYVFEEIAARMLQDNPKLAEKLAEKRSKEPDFAKNSEAQLLFLYRQSPYYEPTHLRYPVFRVEF